MNFEPRTSYQIMFSRDGQTNFFKEGGEISDEKQAGIEARKRRGSATSLTWALVKITRERVEF